MSMLKLKIMRGMKIAKHLSISFITVIPYLVFTKYIYHNHTHPCNINMAELQQECTEEAQPTTAIVVLGEAMFFKPQANVISITLFYREQFREALDQMAVPDSLEIMHIVVRSSDLNSLYDPEAIKEFVPCLKGGAELMVHVLVGENQTSGMKMEKQ
jgi:hypothetical protein